MASIGHKLFQFKLFSFRRLSTQMIVYFLGIALISLALVSYVAYRSTVKELRDGSSMILWSIAQKQKGDITNYMERQQKAMNFFANTLVVKYAFTSLNNTKDVKQAKENQDYFGKVHYNIKSMLDDFIEKSNFKEILLINLDGDIVSSAGNKPSLYTNIMNSKSINTELSQLFQRTMMFLTTQMSNFHVSPLNDYNLFVAVPVFDEKRLLGALIAQLDVDSIFKVINNESSRFDKTGETVILARVGDNMTMLNPTRFQSKSFVQLNEGSQQLKEVKVAFKDTVGKPRGIGEAIDYRGKEVLVAWEYLPNLRWGLIVKKDMSEVLIPVIKLRQRTLMIAIIVCVIVLFVGIGVTHSLTRPILSLTQVAKKIADGDLTATVGKAPDNEIGILANSVKAMSNNLKAVVGQIKNWGKELAETTEEVSKVMGDQSLAAQETEKASINITASSRRISSLARELSGTMHEVSDVVHDTALLAESGIDGLHIMEAAMNELTTANTEVSRQLGVIQEKADGISSIVTTMTKVADQTNLLSLNAAIEARQAGTYGKGFKVVALEIKRLADQVASSTLEIENMISEMLKAVHKGVTSMQHLSSKVEYEAREITNVSTHLTSVIQQVQGLPLRFETVVQGMETQTERADQIKDSITNLSQSAQLTVTSLHETTRKLTTLKTAAAELQHEISKFKDK